MRVFEGSFSGRTLFKNEDFVSPNDVRKSLKLAVAHKYVQRQAASDHTEKRKKLSEMPKDDLMTIYED